MTKSKFSKFFQKIMFSCLFLISSYTFSQEYVDNKAWVKVINPIYESNEESEGFTGNQEFNDFLTGLNVIKYEPALPFAKNPELLKYYEIECEGCDLSAFETYINSNEIVDFVEFQKEFHQEEMIAHDPADYMWWLHLNDPNYNHMWYLDRIEADKAWDITTGDPNVTIAVIDSDVDITHPDLASEILLSYDPYSLAPFGCVNTGGFAAHGTSVAGMASGETSPQGTTPAGQMPSIGYNTKMYFYHSSVGYHQFLQKVLHASNVMGVRAVVSAASSGIGCNTYSAAKPIIKEVLDNGTSIIAPAGNGYSGAHCGTAANPTPFYPFHPSYDDRIIVVSSTGMDDRHYQAINGTQRTHSRFSGVDVCAPGFDLTVSTITNCSPNPAFPYYGYAAGTSFASPLVAGIVSLMYSINPCLSTADVHAIIKSTTDPIVDAASYPGLVGTGRVNAYEAVKRAQNTISPTLDLYIKDRPEDVGISGGYHWQASRDNSPDIWVRRQNDGLTNQTHQSPEYQSATPSYVYVRVRNKSCVTSSRADTLRLYWTKASSWSSWPQNWNGSQPNIGNKIGEFVVPALPPGKDSVFTFTWNILNPNIFNNWSTCLLARIEGNPIDPITIYPGRLDDDVYFNNNIAMKNITIIDSVMGIVRPWIDEVLHAPGRLMYIGNGSSDDNYFDFHFTQEVDNNSGYSMVDDAELRINTDEDGWELLVDAVESTDGIEIDNANERSFIITSPDVTIENVAFDGGVRVPIYVNFNFLTDEVAGHHLYTFKIEQHESDSEKLLGGEHFEIQRGTRELFNANAGSDQEIQAGQSTVLYAEDIGEEAEYRWYNSNGTLMGEEPILNITPDESDTYTLKITTMTDGYRDYDEVAVDLQYNWIVNISPNPALNDVRVDYVLNTGNIAFLYLTNSSGVDVDRFNIVRGSTFERIDLSSYDPGSYTISLVIDDVIHDSQTLIKQ